MSQTAIVAAPVDMVDIVGAAEACFARFSVAKTTVEDIAAGAGVSRATVYRHFPGGRDEIILAVLLRSAQAFLPQLPARLGSARSVADAIVDLVVSAVDWVRGEPWRVRMLTTPLSRTAEAADAAAIYAACTEFIAPYFSHARAAGLVRRGVQLTDAVEYVVRMIHSLLVVPGHRDRSPAELRRYVRTYVVGALLVR